MDKTTELYRPAFHFSPQRNWMNDPNGLVWLKGKYHLFYQYYPNDIIWGPMHWGHAESADLIHWKHLPIALYPDKLGYIFSGSVVIDKTNCAGFGQDAMIAIFTYHNNKFDDPKMVESQGIAYSLDEGFSWEKYENNPVLEDNELKDFRDPKVFWNEKFNKWNMVLSAGDSVKIYSSENLKKWNFESDFIPKYEKEYGVFECPDLFPLHTPEGEKWVMLISQTFNAHSGGSGTQYVVGNFDGKNFYATQNPQWLDFGTDNYAGVTFSNTPLNKKIILSWMSNWQYADKTPTKSWRSAMTLPRELDLLKNGNTYFLTQKIVSQFSAITRSIFSAKHVTLPVLLKDINFSRSDISFDIFPKNDFLITFSNERNEKYVIKFHDQQLIFDRRFSGKIDFSNDFAKKVQQLTLPKSDSYKLEIILDASSMEILINNGIYSVINLIFPEQPYDTFLIESKENTSIQNFQINQVESIF